MSDEDREGSTPSAPGMRVLDVGSGAGDVAFLAAVRPGCLVVFHEIDHTGVGSLPPSRAGLPEPSLRLEAQLAGGTKSLDRLQRVADLVGTLLPELERLGVTTAAEVQLESPLERMKTETIAASSVIFGHWQIAAWSRV